MVYTRQPSAPNTIKLNLDFPTLDALKALAATRKETVERTAYAILQQALGLARDQAGAKPAEPGPDYGPAFNLDSFAAFKPKQPGGL